MRWLLTTRAVLGEYHPGKLTRKEETDGRVTVSKEKDGEPIEGVYPAIVSPATFANAQAALGGRRREKTTRDSRDPNLFVGLLRDALTDASFLTVWRNDRGVKHRVLMTAVKDGGSVSFPYPAFERAILALLKEVDPRELLPPSGADDEVLRLKGELAAVDLEIAAIVAEMDREYSAALAGVLRRKEEKKKTIATNLADASQRAASPLAESWGEAKSLLGLIDSTGRSEALMLRLRAVLRRLIDTIRVVIVPRGMTRLCALQVFFTGTREDRPRGYLIANRSAWAGKSAHRRPARWWAMARAFSRAFDLRQREDAAGLTEELKELDVPAFIRACEAALKV